MRTQTLFAFFLLATLCIADTTWVADTVSGVWTAAGNPYVVTGECYVADGESLFITEGVRIVSGDTSEAVLHGDNRLKMQGSAEFPIYDTRVTINYPLEIQYCIIDSCSTGVFNPLHLSFVEITNCYCGIYIDYRHTYIEFCNINNCSIGSKTILGGSQLNATRTLFHHNYIGLSSDCCIAALWAESRLYYCTFVDNEYSIEATACSTYWWSGSGGWWEHGSSVVRVYNSLICDEYFQNASQNYNSPYIPDLSPEYYPIFVNPLLCDYRLNSLSLYIDMADTSYGYPPDSFYGGNPDIGAFESPYTALERCVFYKSSYTVNFPLASIGDTSYAFKSIYNNGTSCADSIKMIIDSPFGFVGIADSSLPVLVSNTITFSYFPDYITLYDTAVFVWYLNDLSDTIMFILNGYETAGIIGEVSGTLSVELSPYTLDDAFVPCGESLIIEPGVEITGDLTVYGCLSADGTALDSIFFESCVLSFNTDSLCSPDSSRLSYCDFNNTTIYAKDSVSVKVLNSHMTGNRIALDFRGKSTLWLESSCLNGYILKREYLLIGSDSKISLLNCEIRDNVMKCHSAYVDPYNIMYYYNDFIGVFNNTYLLIDNCVFEDNTTSCSSGGAIMDFVDLFVEKSHLTINNSLFSNNKSYRLIELALLSGITSDGLFTNCIFQAGEFAGDGSTNEIYNNRGSASFYNCDFIDIKIRTQLSNTIVFNSLFLSAAFTDILSVFHHCLLPPGSSVSDSSSVIFGTPTFASDTSYMLAPTSLGIDMGAEFAVTDSGDTIWAPLVDFYGNPRPSGGGFDIGAAEFQWETYSPTISCGIGWNLVSCPVADTVDITDIFPFVTGPAFSYENSTGAYLFSYTMIPGTGYWAPSSDTSSIELSAGLLDSVTVEIHRGWNLIGAVGGPFNTANFGGWFMPPAYRYDVATRAYIETSVFLPGCGYWVLSNAETTAVISR